MPTRKLKLAVFVAGINSRPTNFHAVLLVSPVQARVVALLLAVLVLTIVLPGVAPALMFDQLVFPEPSVVSEYPLVPFPTGRLKVVVPAAPCTPRVHVPEEEPAKTIGIPLMSTAVVLTSITFVKEAPTWIWNAVDDPM